MALGRKTTKEAKPSKAELNLERYNLTDINPEDAVAAAEILKTLQGTNMMQLGMTLQMKKPEDSLPVFYLKSIMEQNWIMIKQLDRITKLLEEK